MKKLSVIAGILSMVFFAVACNEPAPAEEPAVEGQSAVQEEIIMPESSELALLMRKMFDENMAMKQGILNGELPTSFPEEFLAIHSSNATEPEKITEAYHAMADAYLESVKNVVAADQEHSVTAFNNMVTSCINCHKTVACMGPIPKIKQLRIKPDEA